MQSKQLQGYFKTAAFSQLALSQVRIKREQASSSQIYRVSKPGIRKTSPETSHAMETDIYVLINTKVHGMHTGDSTRTQGSVGRMLMDRRPGRLRSTTIRLSTTHPAPLCPLASCWLRSHIQGGTDGRRSVFYMTECKDIDDDDGQCYVL